MDPTAPSPAPAPAAAAPRRPWKLILFLVLLSPLLLFALYTWVALHWAYSDGYRSGVLQKFSQKGWVCKTYEGELWQSVVANVAPDKWYFTVRDKRIVAAMDTLVGRTVRLHYTEHRGVPTTCFGETSHFVDSVVVVSQ